MFSLALFFPFIFFAEWSFSRIVVLMIYASRIHHTIGTMDASNVALKPKVPALMYIKNIIISRYWHRHNRPWLLLGKLPSPPKTRNWIWHVAASVAHRTHPSRKLLIPFDSDSDSVIGIIYIIAESMCCSKNKRRTPSIIIIFVMFDVWDYFKPMTIDFDFEFDWILIINLVERHERASSCDIVVHQIYNCHFCLETNQFRKRNWMSLMVWLKPFKRFERVCATHHIDFRIKHTFINRCRSAEIFNQCSFTPFHLQLVSWRQYNPIAGTSQPWRFKRSTNNQHTIDNSTAWRWRCEISLCRLESCNARGSTTWNDCYIKRQL